MLAARISSLAPELLPDGRRVGHEWEALNPATGKYGSWNIHIGPGKPGVWKNFVSGEGGDALDLVAHVLFRDDKKRALQWSLRWLGLDSGDPNAIETVRQATPPPAEVDARAAEHQAKMRNNALRIWMSAQTQLLGTPVDMYLRGRGIVLADLDRLPGAIRFHPGLFNVESQSRWPAMVAAIAGPGVFMACHRTWLKTHADGTVTKAPLKDPKLTLGHYRGGHISLWRGASGRSLRDALPGETVDISEGIEDGLSVAWCAPECRVIAAVSLSNPQISLPPAITAVRLWKQNDTHPETLKSFDRMVRAQLAAGREVLIAGVPREVKDVNDLLRMDAAK